MKYGSVCSGIEAATVAWHPLGWQPMWYSQFDPEWNYAKRGPDFPSRVLAHHYPQVPNLGDMTKLTENKLFNDTAIDVLVGGTPCQSFSVAGLRNGLDDERGNLSLEFVRLLMCKRPKWFIWENVPGVLSSKSGEEEESEGAGSTSDFACILSAFTGLDVQNQPFGKCGIISGTFYSIGWRIFDAQYFGVPQRRRRVFVVGHIGNDWRPLAAVLFERDSLRRDFTPSRETRKGITGVAETGIDSNSKQQLFDKQALGEYSNSGVTSTIAKRDSKDATDLIVTPFTAGGFADYLQSHQSSTLKKNGHDLGGGSESLIVLNDQGGDSINVEKDNISPTLRANSHQHEPIIAFSQNQQGDIITGEVMHTLNTNSNATGRNAPNIAYGIQANIIGRKDENGGNGKGVKLEQAPTLTKLDQYAVCIGFNSIPNPPLTFKIRQGKPGGGKVSLAADNRAFTIATNQDQYLFAPIRYGESQQDTMHFAGGIMNCLPKGSKSSTSTFTNTLIDTQVRRLTPLECERLQGFPDNYTLIPDAIDDRYKDMAKATDSNRYQAIGNSMAVPVMHYIGEQIDKVETILKTIDKK